MKKQSQFVPELMGVKSCKKVGYDNKPAGGAEENKANQSQSPATVQTKGAGKKRKIARSG